MRRFWHTKFQFIGFPVLKQAKKVLSHVSGQHLVFYVGLWGNSHQVRRWKRSLHLGQVMAILPLCRGTRTVWRQRGQVK